MRTSETGKTIALVLAFALPALAMYAIVPDARTAGLVGVVCVFVYMGWGSNAP